MNLQARVLTLNELAEIWEFEMQALASLDESSRMIAGWGAKWQKEALEFFIPLGWSFAVRDESERLRGYFLAQPLLFFRGFTQTLWVEHVAFRSPEVQSMLIEIAIKWGRDKHLQRVLFSDFDTHKEMGVQWKMTRVLDAFGEVRTTKA